MREGEGLGMQGRSLNQVRPRGAIEAIRQQRKAQRECVDSDLVRTPSSGHRLKESIPMKSFQNMERCLGWLPLAVIDGGAMAVPHIDA